MLSGVAGDGDEQRRTRVLQAAEHAGRGEHDQQRGGAEEGDARGRSRRARRRADPASKTPTRTGVSDDPADGRDGADDHRQPDAVDALGERAAQVAGAEVARDAGGGAVGEEDAQADDGLQDDRRDAEAGELGGAEVTDDRGVGEQEERLGDEGEEGRDGQAQDLAVDGLHASSA